MNYMILFWCLFGLGILAFLVNFIGSPILRKKMDKKVQHEQDLKISKIKKGDKVMLVSGIFGYVTKIHKRTFEVEISKGVIIRVDQQGIMGFFEGKRKK